jgi:N-acyl-D-aspartate/D-glutamate deacylase
MPLDLLIKDGTIIDGTGAPRYRGDVGVADGKIIEIGRIKDSARQVINAEGRVVAPGFIDPHTHYDAQICWDPELSPSSWHGVTTVITGNCGVGLAPCLPESREVAARDLVLVEAIPFDVLQAGVTWDWISFPDYMQAAARRGTALNIGFLAPLTPFRHFVMGEASQERAATPEERAKIRALLAEAVQAGAFGFTTSRLKQHIGYGGKPLACRLADWEELKAYAGVLRQFGRGAIQLALTQAPSIMSDEEYRILDMLLAESGRCVTFLALFYREDEPDACHNTLVKAAPLLARGAFPQVSPSPLTREMSMHNPFTMASFQSFGQIYDKPADVQAKIYADPSFRQHFREELKTNRVFHANWEMVRLANAATPALKELEGKTIAEIAASRGRDGVDTYFDLTVEDGVGNEYSIALFNATDSGVKPLLQDNRTLIALSDAGAHVDLMCDAGFSSMLLGKWVREQEIMTLEQGVYRLTAHPAAIFGIADRGRLKTGQAADLVVFDPDTIGSDDRRIRLNDLPGGGRRFVAPSVGVDYTIVNGNVAFADGKVTGSRAGRVLHS